MKTLSIPGEAVGDYALYDTQGNSAQDLSAIQVHGGTYSHRCYITGANAADNEGSTVHRAYGLIHLDQLPVGVFQTPCLITLWVWLDIALSVRAGIDDWFSFATLTSVTDWAAPGIFTVNLNTDGYVYLQHVPTFGEQVWTYQAGPTNNGPAFPMQQWVKMDIYYEGSPTLGYAKVFQNGVLVSWAPITSGNGQLARLHFGMYASPAVAAGTVYNDDIFITEAGLPYAGAIPVLYDDDGD